MGFRGLKMSSTLDKLKALNDKLEAKLSEQEPKGQKQEKKPKESPKKTRPAQSAAATESEKDLLSDREIGKLLVNVMHFDANREPTRAENLHRIAELYTKLGIRDKAPEAEKLFIYKAMNISGIGLKEEDFGEIRAGKYVQVIAITYEPDKNGKKKAKNISLGYFGKAETLEESHKNEIIEFVLRWRYEKAFQNLEHYKDLLERVRPGDRLF